MAEYVYTGTRKYRVLSSIGGRSLFVLWVVPAVQVRSKFLGLVPYWKTVWYGRAVLGSIWEQMDCAERKQYLVNAALEFEQLDESMTIG